MEVIGALRDVETPEEKIKEILVKRFGITPTYAQNLLDTEPSEHVVEAV